MDHDSCADRVCPAQYRHAQGGCEHCLEALLRTHEGLVWYVVRRQWRGRVPVVDLVQEGRIALWQAILGYDVDRETAFSSYAVVVMQRRLWRVVREAEREPALPLAVRSAPSAAAVWANEEGQRQVAVLLKRLPLRLQRVVVQAYGFAAAPALSLAAIARQQGLSRERLRQLRNDALVHLRLQILAGAEIGIELDRQRYRRLQRLNQAWLDRPGRRRA